MSEPFLGQIQTYRFKFATRGWAKCDGQVMQIASNTALFSLLGTTYGGDGRTNFRLPDLRGRDAIHQGQGPGLSNRTIGTKMGQEKTTLVVGNLPAHNHSLNARAEDGNQNKPENNLLAAGNAIYHTTPSDTVMSSESIGMTGQAVPIERIPPGLVINWCIALTGVFPSRNKP